MRTNQAGIDLIKSFEGCKLDSYRDIVNILTIGYGHVGPDVHEGMEINQSMADGLLQHDLERFELGVSGMIAGLNSNQFSALVCFAYNVGLGNLKASTLLKKALVGDMDGAAAEFLKWNHAGGQVVAGLTRRRQAESDLFRS